MSTETTDAEAAWEAYYMDPDSDVSLDARPIFMAGRESLSARLDALHAENLAREQWWHNVSLNLYAERDEARAENQRLRDALIAGDTDPVAFDELLDERDRIAAERDALRDAVRGLADEWDRTQVIGMNTYAEELRERLSEESSGAVMLSGQRWLDHQNLIGPADE